MAAYFFDSSAIVKRHITEIGSSWIVGLTHPTAGSELFLARITAVEVAAAITRRRRGGTVSAAVAPAALAQFRYDLAHQYQVMELSRTLLDHAMTLAEQHGLRAYDAVQLAAALELQTERLGLGLQPAVLVSADVELNAAAAAEGLVVDDPNAHP